MAKNMTVSCLGAFPPPINGQAKNLDAITTDIENTSSGCVIRRNVALGALKRTPLLILRRGLRYARHWFGLAWKSRCKEKKIYMTSEGDRLIFLTVLTVGLARLLRYKIVVQHRSFAYINEYSNWMSRVNKLMGEKAHHVFLTEGMAERFYDLYQPRRPFIVNHNLTQSKNIWAAARKLPRPRPDCSAPLRVGLMSNLLLTKGVDTFLDMAVMAHRSGVNAVFELGGPVPGPEEQRIIDNAKKELGEKLVLNGPLRSEEKIAYFRRLDVFVFPTRYRFEAQPNVILEALCCGCAVIGADRGCIAEDVSEMGGWIVPGDKASDSREYFSIIKALTKDRTKLRAVQAKSLCLTHKRLRRAVNDYQKMLALFL